MDVNYRDALATHGRTLITHIGLVNGSGTELASAGYARQAVTWTTASNGQIKPTANLVYNMVSGNVVAGWRGYSALTGGTNYGGASLTQVTFSNNGTYTLTAADTAINHNSV